MQGSPGPSAPDLFSESTLLTAGGATLAVAFVATGIRKFTGFNAAWVPLALGAVASFGLALNKGTLATPLGFFTAVVNAFVIASAAVGGNEVTYHATAPRTDTESAKEQLGAKPQDASVPARKRTPLVRSYFE